MKKKNSFLDWMAAMGIAILIMTLFAIAYHIFNIKNQDFIAGWVSCCGFIFYKYRDKF